MKLPHHPVIPVENLPLNFFAKSSAVDFMIECRTVYSAVIALFSFRHTIYVTRRNEKIQSAKGSIGADKPKTQRHKNNAFILEIWEDLETLHSSSMISVAR